jgi:hypothetical protein
MIYAKDVEEVGNNYFKLKATGEWVHQDDIIDFDEERHNITHAVNNEEIIQELLKDCEWMSRSGSEIIIDYEHEMKKR